jgi:hypothetical protein
MAGPSAFNRRFNNQTVAPVAPAAAAVPSVTARPSAFPSGAQFGKAPVPAVKASAPAVTANKGAMLGKLQNKAAKAKGLPVPHKGGWGSKGGKC